MWMLILAGSILLSIPAIAQEHPEHPKGSEHPSEHPSADDASSHRASIEELVDGITAYVDNTAELSGDSYTFFDSVENQPLALEISKVHADKITYLDPDAGICFFCADFKNIDGTMYDLDFIMDTTDAEYKPIQISLHKKDGNARYNWVEKDGVWKRQEIK